MKTIAEGYVAIKREGLANYTKEDMFHAGASCALSILMALDGESDSAAAGILDGLRIETNAHFGQTSDPAVVGNLHQPRSDV